MKFVTDILTGKDNLTFDAARVVGVAGAGAYIIFWSAAVFHLGSFTATDAAAYSSGLGLVMITMAGAVKLKRDTEPEPK